MTLTMLCTLPAICIIYNNSKHALDEEVNLPGPVELCLVFYYSHKYLHTTWMSLQGRDVLEHALSPLCWLYVHP